MWHLSNRQANHFVRELQVWTIALLVTGGVANMTGEAAGGCHGGPDRENFDWTMVEDATPLPNGLMWVGYRDAEGTVISHASLHRVERVLPGVETSLPEEEASRFTLLITDGTLTPMTYVILTAPLYYGTDLDEQGWPRELWLDADEDGINGNESPAPALVFAESDRLDLVSGASYGIPSQ